MYHHIQLTKRKLRSLIDKGAIKFGGNEPLKIYGTLSCKSGKRMKKENRVFFQSGEEAVDEGYRPCGHCMKAEYQKWKEGRSATVQTYHIIDETLNRGTSLIRASILCDLLITCHNTTNQ